MERNGSVHEAKPPKGRDDYAWDVNVGCGPQEFSPEGTIVCLASNKQLSDDTLQELAVALNAITAE